jgi:anthranilate/para-aminobenzoate synthase component I
MRSTQLVQSQNGTLLIETLPLRGKSAIDLFERFGWKEETVLFEGMRGGWFDGRFSLLAGMPFAKFQSKEETSRFESLGDGEGSFFVRKGNPLAHLQECLDRFQSSPLEGPLSEIPFLQGGAAGFFSYDLVRQWEQIPPPSILNPALPDILFLFFNLFALLDHERKQLYLVYNPLLEIEMGKSEESAHREGREKLALLRSKVFSPRSPREMEPHVFSPTIQEEISRDRYIEMVLRAKEYIADGDIFQANLSHRFRVVSPLSPFHVYQRLHRINPSPFAAYLDLGVVQIASSSPERLVQVRKSGEKRFVATRPIAGTHPRGGDETEDQRMIRALYKSEKERAEHLMLVDLERNDLGRVCRYGTIEVDALMSIEKYSHVLHLVSNIQGELRPEVTLTEVVQALFPGGTITGVPKVRCMEILSELEQRARGIYTGAVGYIDFTGEMDLNIVIRTWVRQGEEMTFQVGAGVVADSDPEREYRETLQKAAALIKALDI